MLQLLPLALSLLVTLARALPQNGPGTFEDQRIIFPETQPVRHPDAVATRHGLNAASNFEPDAGPIDQDQNFSVEMPFKSKCEKHVVNYKNNATQVMTMEPRDQIAIYPMNGADVNIQVVMKIKETVFKNEFVGDALTVYQCDEAMTKCRELDVNSAKRPNLIKKDHWNYIYVTLEDGLISLNVNNMTTQKIRCEYSLEEMAGAQWYFEAYESPDPTKNIEHVTSHTPSMWNYLAIYPCAEYKELIENELGTAAPHIETEKPKTDVEEGADISLIIGIVVGVALAIVVATIVAVLVVRAIKKRKSANISSEAAPINSGAKGGK